MMLSIPSLKYLLALLVLCGSVLGLTLAGNMPPAAAQQELQITLLGTHPLPGAGQDVVVVDNQAYVLHWITGEAAGGRGLRILDTSDLDQTRIIGEYTTESRLPRHLVITETYAFVSFSTLVPEQGGRASSGFLILDIQDPAAPQLLSIYEVAEGGGDFAVVGNQVYLGLNPFDPDGPELGQLHIVDVRDPSAPALMGIYDVPDDQIAGLAAQGNTVYLGGFDTGFTAIDVSDPGNPTLIGRWTTPGPPPVRPVVEGDVLYFAGRNLFTIDISDPTNPQTLAVGGAAGTRIWVQDGIVYLVGNTTNSLNIVDARNPRNLVRLAQYGEDIDLAIPAGDLVYLVADDQLQIVRVTGIPAAPPADPPSPTARCFDETGYCIDGRIRDYWEQNGGLPVFGFPISVQRTFPIEGQPIEAQWFERNRLELHPENAPPYDVLLGRLGVDVLEQQGRDWQAFPRDEAAQPGCRYFAETQQNVCGDILTAWRANGLELGDLGISERESLALFGLPISPLQEEDIEGQTYQVQWFERARFELHPENAPPFDVLLGLLGREARP